MRGEGHTGPKGVRDLADAELLGGGERQQDLEALVVREHREHRADSLEALFAACLYAIPHDWNEQRPGR